ncbi:MAG: DUF29 domain-containing protein [Telluria sp.]
MGTSYDTDIVAWANEQAALLRAGRLDAIDTLHIAEEIEDVARSERRELGSELVVLIAHLLSWKFQPARRTRSWRSSIRVQRDAVHFDLTDTPSLKHCLEDEPWLALLWKRARVLAERETGLDLPEHPIWPLGQVLDNDFWPD